MYNCELGLCGLEACCEKTCTTVSWDYVGWKHAVKILGTECNIDIDITNQDITSQISWEPVLQTSEVGDAWIDCLYIHREEIRRSIRFYHENEHECLKTATSKDAETIEDVKQLEKQIVKWRKGYRYLTNLCSNENPVNEEMAQQCLIEYMQYDKYDEVIQRLMLLKQGAMSDLYANFNSTLIEMEECLRSQLSRYLDRIRSTMDTLNKCYSTNT